MGLTIFAIFSINKKSNISQSFSYQVESDEYHLGRPSVIRLHDGAFNDTYQLWVSYEPRAVYPYRLNKWRHLRVSFLPNCSDTKVAFCGARLLYKQDLDDFVQTIVDSVLGCSLNLHEFYNGVFLGGMLSLIRSQRYDPDQEDKDEDEDQVEMALKAKQEASSSLVSTTRSSDDNYDHYFELKKSLHFFFQRSFQVLSISISLSFIFIRQIFLGKNIAFLRCDYKSIFFS